MPSLISRLNCFSRKNKQKTLDDGGSQLLLPSGSGSNSTSPTRRGVGGSSSDKSILSPGLSPQNNKHDRQNDDMSIPTVDPDYNHQSGNCSLSDAGGTVGTHNQSLSNFSQAQSAFGSIMPSSQFGATGGDLGIAPPQMPLKKDVYLEIFAPSGKLGLTIDTPPMALMPVVVGIKETCPIRNEIKVDDKLVAVDDIDVREMTATEVSRLIGRKKDQEKRKLTIIRSAYRGDAGNGMYGNGMYR